MKNRIREIRTEKNLTQRQLAELAGTSQQQLQRIESGKQAVRFDIATKVCAALEASMEEVFPETKVPLARAREVGASQRALLNDASLNDALAEGGIEADPREWSMKYLLRNGTTGAVTVSGQEYRRLHRAVQRTSPGERFVVFDTASHRMAINLDHLVFSQFLSEPQPDFYFDEAGEESSLVSVYTTATQTPLTFIANPDEVDMEEEDPNEGEGVQLQGFFYDLEQWSDTIEVVSFVDEDGERAFFRSADIMMVAVPLWLLEPNRDIDENAAA